MHVSNDSASVSGKNLNDIQAMNRSLVLRLMQKNGVCSRAQLAKESGLKQATMTNIINDFLDWGLVEETGMLPSVKGRRSIGVVIRHQAFYVIGVRLTRNFFDIGLFDMAGNLANGKTVDIRRMSGPAPVVAAIRREIEEILKRNRKRMILGVGMAVPGPFFYHEKQIELITDFPGWNEIDLRSDLFGSLDLPVIIDHDANAGALAEWWIAPNELTRGTIVYVAVGQGLGAGIINDGRILRGALGIAGEIGHTTIDLNGPPCACGNRGCLTNYASTTHMVSRYREETGKSRATDDAVDFPAVASAIAAGEAAAMKVYRETMRYLAVGINNAIWTYGPDRIIIGDEMSAIGPRMIGAIQEFFTGRTLSRILNRVEIRLSSFERDPAYVGAAALAIDHCLENARMFERTGR